ncbi:hypothetical protein HMPREF9318_00838 [Streptococcus urinalis FB127-CNA-2]|uniref:Glyoxalase family protein n=1 Tax=Streptococcus urinalis 2285-97 TaxID=764291 RepID=G5KHX2_9STRE|nr:VOC family protein [Streptococcus urinalis]EHJ55655.1 glyoxalase family protein [Streptococcus urinalis 2285-97]EKS22640.1 hypothetical protein HMPREF9318_00838 [Streptococcus urinalis FB127-CNA-2]VEF32409.1 bleomycin resistance protein [Streptococcus urinalis]
MVKIEHVALWERDIELEKNFYCKHFNGKVSELYHNSKTGFYSYFISFSNGARLEVMSRADLDEGTRNQYGFTHIAVSLGSKEAVDQKANYFAENGFPIQNGPRVTGDGYYEAVIYDPEGNQIELTV